MNLLQTAEQFSENHPVTTDGFEPVKKYAEDTKFEDQQHRRDDSGRLLWDVLCSTKEMPRGTFKFKVRIASVNEPDIEPGLIRFGGFEARTYPDGQRNVVTFAADTFTQTPPPSTKRTSSKASGPPPPSS